MTTTYQWKWTWSTTDKKNANNVRQSSSSITSRTLPARGAYDINKLNAIHNETLNDITRLYALWNNTIQPVLDSLPAGGSDRRWNLRKEIDVYSYGIDASTLFVLNGATSTVADGRYWHSTENRPYTISEILEDHDGRLAAVEALGTSSVSSSDFDDTDLWTAIGYGYNGGTSAGGTLDYRCSSSEARLTHLANDLYGQSRADSCGGGWAGWSWSDAQQSYGVLEYLTALLALHEVVPTDCPWDVSHAALGAHTHPQTEIEYSTGTLARGVVATDNLRKDLQRIRYEIGYTRGTAWDSGTIVGPFVTNYPSAGNLEQTLYSHINYKGTGTASSTNPHAHAYADDSTAVAVVSAVTGFTGMTTPTDSSPTYSSTNYISNGDNLETALGKIDDGLATLVFSTVTRTEYYVDRSAYSEEYREQNPITITHSNGKKPLINVLDNSPEGEDSYNQYISLTTDANIVHVSDDEFQVWTTAADVLIIAIY